jgi:hypothetical protein
MLRLGVIKGNTFAEALAGKVNKVYASSEVYLGPLASRFTVTFTERTTEIES